MSCAHMKFPAQAICNSTSMATHRRRMHVLSANTNCLIWIACSRIACADRRTQIQRQFSPNCPRFSIYATLIANPCFVLFGYVQKIYQTHDYFSLPYITHKKVTTSHVNSCSVPNKETRPHSSRLFRPSLKNLL